VLSLLLTTAVNRFIAPILRRSQRVRPATPVLHHAARLSRSSAARSPPYVAAVAPRFVVSRRPSVSK